MEGASEPPRNPIPGTCRAVIDVGTNSVKLLVGRVDGHTVTPILERSEQTRLGAGFFESRCLLPEAIERTAAAAAAFRREADRYRPASLRVLATAAAREAVNQETLVSALRRACRLEVEVISGDREADMAFRGVCSDPSLDAIPLLVTDVGGGSTEFILGRSGQCHFSGSFPIGAVRLFDHLRPPEAPTPADLARCRQCVDQFLGSQVADPVFAACRRETDGRPITWVGVGGTALILGRLVLGLDTYDRDRLEGSAVSAATLISLTERLWACPVEARRRLPGLPSERADIILTGAAIHEGILRLFQLPSLRLSTRGLRFAALMDRP